MTILRSPILGLLLGALSLPAADPFDDQHRAIRPELEKRELPASILPKFEALLASADNLDRRLEATWMLCEALSKAGLPEQAANRWGELARLHEQRADDSRANRVFGAEINRLRCLERMQPQPFQRIADTARTALAYAGPPTWSLNQRMELVEFAAKGIQGAKDVGAAVAFLEELITQAANEPSLRGELLLRLAQIHERAKADELVLATLARVHDEAKAPALQRALALMQRARQLDRMRRPGDAIDAALKALPAYKEAAGADFGWWGTDTLHWASEFAQRNGRPDDALRFAETLTIVAGKDRGWLSIARMDAAGALARQGKLAEADAIYSELIASGEERASEALLRRALLQLHEIGDRALGQKLLEQALLNERIAGWRRFNEAFDEAGRALGAGERDRAEAIYQLILRIPSSAEEQASRRSGALLALGRIAESRGDQAKAKQFYEQARDNAGGNPGERAQARNALESIRYFE